MVHPLPGKPIAQSLQQGGQSPFLNEKTANCVSGP